MITTTQTSVTRIGSVVARLPDVAGFGLPHSSRRPAVSVEVGFHSANGWSQVGRVWSGTKTFEMNVIGKRTVKIDLLGDLDGRDHQAEPDPEPRHRVGEDEQEQEARERGPGCSRPASRRRTR